MPEEDTIRRSAVAVTRGQVVVTPGEAKLYKVVLELLQTKDTEHPVSSVREGEAFIRSKGAVAGAFRFESARETPGPTPPA
jgi:hypothetical protein